MKALITGATGFVGRHLAQRLPDAVVAGRSMERLLTLFPGRDVREWSVEGDTAGFLDGVDTVFHLAGESLFNGRWNRDKKRRIYESRVQGTKSIVSAIACADRKPSLLVCASAVGYYGSRGDEILTEDAGAGDDFLARLCVDWEREALKACKHGVRVVIVRIGVVLGRNGGALAQMVPLFRMGLGGRLGSGRQYMPWIHIEDLAGLMLHAAKDMKISGPVNGVSPEPVTNMEFARGLAGGLRRPCLIPAPAFVLRMAIGEFADVLLASQRVIPKVMESSGYRFRFGRLSHALENLL